MRNNQKGITFLLAVIVSSIALSISLGIAFVLLEELKLSNLNRDSFAAFFAADSGIDCVLYWDFKEKSPNDNTVSFFMDPVSGALACGGGSPNLIITKVPGVSVKTEFSLALGNKCANVTVEKTRISTKPRTRIQSLGQNIACGAAPNLRIVQRGIEVTY